MPASDRAAMHAELRAGLIELGLAAPATALDALLNYLDLLVRWNATYNLTAVRDPRQMVTQHLLDSLAVMPLVRGARIADIGSGAGLPGIPLAILAPHWQITLVDANGKKTRFLREAARVLRLGNVRIQTCRVESLAGEYDTITARAFGVLADIVRLAGHLLAADGQLLALKGQLHAGELTGLPNGFVVAETRVLHVPGLAAARHAVIVRRVPAGAGGQAA